MKTATVSFDITIPTDVDEQSLEDFLRLEILRRGSYQVDGPIDDLDDLKPSNLHISYDPK